MDLSADINPYPGKRMAALPPGQVLLLLGLLVFWVPCILSTIPQAAYNAVALMIVVSISGLFLCRDAQLRLNDPALKVLGYFWLLKLGATLFLLYAGWIPQLDPSAGNWGYDPQRFYVQAKELIDNSWLPDFLSLNYVGVLYYYGAIYYALGYNPIIPALVNSFVTLIASLYLLRVGYEIKTQRDAGDWVLAFAILLPELMWFDVMTSRETLMAALLIFSMFTAGRYFARISSLSSFWAVSVVGLSVIAIAAVRTSMLVPVLASIVLIAGVVNPRRGRMIFQKAAVASAAVAALVIGAIFTKYIGGYDFDMAAVLKSAFSAKENVALGPDLSLGWSENSIGLLLMPEGILQSLLFLPIRMILYLLAPLPKIMIPISELAAGSFEAWQNLMTLASSLINVVAMPYVLASLVQAIRIRKENIAPLVFHIPYWTTFAAIAGGNLIVHERYRIMASLMLWGCAWLGAQTCPRRLVVNMAYRWYGLLALGASFYIVYKSGLIRL